MTVLPRLLVQCGALPLSGPRGSNQIIWSDPVEWNGVREGQPVALCFSLRSNVIRAQWERHGLDCNPPESLPPRALICLHHPSLCLRLIWSLVSVRNSINQAPSPFQPQHVIGIQLLSFPTQLSVSHLPSRFINIVSQSLAGSTFLISSNVWSLSTMVLLTFSLNDSDWKSPHINLAVWGVISQF